MEDGDSVLLDVTPTEIEDQSTRVNHVYQQIRLFNNACDKKNIPQIKKLLTSYTTLQNSNIPKLLNGDIFQTSETKNTFRNQIMDVLLTEAYNEFVYDSFELLFFASAKFEVERLREIIKELKMDSDSYFENLNQTRYSDSAIMFAIKYGNVENKNLLECMTVLIEAGIDINKYDVKGKFVIDYIALLYEHFKNKNKDETNNVTVALKSVAKLFLDKGIYSSDNTKTMDFLTEVMQIDVKKYPFVAMDDQTKLYFSIIKNKTDDFLSTRKPIIQKYKDADREENTLLQLASKKTDNMLPIVQFLLKNGADPNKVTKWNKLTPLELAAMNNNQKIFEEILKNKKTEINLKQYNNFVRCRSQPMKVRLFEILLESDKLDPNFTYDKTGNTPLHYAIIFSHKKAIQNLLKRQSSLIIKNKFAKCALDMIDAEDLEKYFDSCLALDNYTPYFSDVNYKMRFRFNCLVDNRMSKEVKVVSKIGKRANLEHLLTHPFVHTFIILKWFKVKFYFWIILIFQATTFMLLSILFYRLPNAASAEYYFCILFAFINVAIKVPIFLKFKFKNRRPVLYTLNRAGLHCCTEIFLMITIIGSFFQNQFRAFLFIEMSLSFLLTTGYHPRLSKWSLMLQQVFKTFTILLMFFSLLVLGFSIGFHILFPEDELFKNFFSSIFRTYIMTTGEFDAGDSNFDTAGFAGYILFLLFAMSMSLVIVNFWTGVAVTDIERIEKNSEINASKNVAIFMLFIDRIYTFKYFGKIRKYKYIGSPLLFLRINEDGFIYHNPEKCEVNFFVNKEKQFEEKNNFPTKVDDDCFNKIRCHYYKLAKVTTDQEILKKLEDLTKMVAEIKSKQMKSEAVISDYKPKKDYRKKREQK